MGMKFIYATKPIGSVIVNEGNNRFFEPADGRNWSAGIKLSKQF